MASPSIPTAATGDGEDNNDEQDAMMMAAMGFGSFGSKDKGPKAKKVKVRQDGSADVSTGGNVIPLGTGRRGGRGGGGGGQRVDSGNPSRSEIASDTMNEGEVAVRWSEDASELRGGEGEGGGGVPLPLGFVGDEDDEAYEGPHYDDDDDGDDNERTKNPSARPPSLPQKPKTTQYNPAATISYHPHTRTQDTNINTPSIQGSQDGGPTRRTEGKNDDGSWDWHALRRGVRDERGNVAFYDRSFVEDPWRGLRG